MKDIMKGGGKINIIKEGYQYFLNINIKKQKVFKVYLTH